MWKELSWGDITVMSDCQKVESVCVLGAWSGEETGWNQVELIDLGEVTPGPQLGV